jgi:serine O-acetyltransferase
MEFIMFEIIKSDARRYFDDGEIRKNVTNRRILWKVITNESLWIIALYRYIKFVNTKIRSKFIRLPLQLPYSVITKFAEMIVGICISQHAEIGKGFYIGHYGGIWIGPVRIGENCNVSQGVTIGLGGKGTTRGLPEIGNRVYIAPGAKVFGKIKIGDNVAIGANSVVSKSIPDFAVVVGNPCRIVSFEGSEGLIELEDYRKFRD